MYVCVQAGNRGTVDPERERETERKGERKRERESWSGKAG
jgi:hypothetical protein